MLVTENVILKWGARNKNYFTDKGYIFTKFGESFIVKVSDLTRRNSSIIEYMCDICFEKYSTTFDNCMNGFDKNGIHKCKKCARKGSAVKSRVDNHTLQNEFISKNLVLLTPVEDYKSNKIKLKFRCNKHPNIIQEINYSGLKKAIIPCRLCNNEWISIRNKGEKSTSWMGGISSIYGFLRRELKNNGWFYDSLKEYNSKCAITGRRPSHVHHLYSFNKILSETINEFNLPIKSKIADYTPEELITFSEKFLLVHKRYPLGAPLTKELHSQYHKLYGDDNTPEQFEEFRKQYAIRL